MVAKPIKTNEKLIFWRNLLKTQAKALRGWQKYIKTNVKHTQTLPEKPWFFEKTGGFLKKPVVFWKNRWFFEKTGSFMWLQNQLKPMKNS